MTARIIRIILPADTTVTVGDTLWWGVEAIDHEERRAVEVVVVGQAPTYNDDGEVTWERCDTHCTRCTRTKCCWCNSPKSLGSAVIDGDWAPIVKYGEHGTVGRYIVVQVEPGSERAFAVDNRSFPVEQQEITLHGHTDPGGYAARFEIVEVPSS